MQASFVQHVLLTTSRDSTTSLVPWRDFAQGVDCDDAQWGGSRSLDPPHLTLHALLLGPATPTLWVPWKILTATERIVLWGHIRLHVLV